MRGVVFSVVFFIFFLRLCRMWEMVERYLH